MNSRKQKLIDEIKGVEYFQDFPAENCTSFKIGGPLSFLAIPKSPEEIITLLKAAETADYPVYVIGNGTNLLISDKGADALFIKTGSAMSGVSFDDDEAALNADAGALLSAAAKESVKRGFMGLEWAAGIPGSIGGGAAMNAGAYGGEMKDVIRSITYVDVKKQEILTKNVEPGDFAYRYSAFTFPGRIVVKIKMQLEQDDGHAKERMDEFNEKRRSKQPLEYPSAGSTFKRPEGFFAGALIENAGLKGISIGGAQVSEKHAGFIINSGGASFDDVYSLINLVREKVYARFNVLLEPEVKIIK